MENLYTVKNLTKKYSKSGIYMILINNKFYIGSSLCISTRLFCHRRRLKSGKHANIILINHFNKYGEEKCFFKILEYCDKKDLLIREKFYIDHLKPELNVETDPINQNGSYKSKTVYQYDLNGNFIKEHLSAAEAERTLGKHSSMIASCARGNTAFKSAYGYLWSYEKKQNLSYSNNSSKSKAKNVYQYDLSGTFLNKHDSVAAATRSLNLKGNFSSHCTNISACCLGKTKQAYGYLWTYSESGHVIGRIAGTS
jgi:group I intron endonuclease